MTTDRGRAALAERLRVCGVIDFMDHDSFEALADAILGEHGEFLPDGLGLRAALEQARLELMQDVDPDAVIALIDAALAVTPSPAGEKPTREEWIEAAREVLKQFGPEHLDKRSNSKCGTNLAALFERECAAALPVHGRPEEEA